MIITVRLPSDRRELGILLDSMKKDNVKVIRANPDTINRLFLRWNDPVSIVADLAATAGYIWWEVPDERKSEEDELILLVKGFSGVFLHQGRFSLEDLRIIHAIVERAHEYGYRSAVDKPATE
jgi:hypothetical protein